MTQFHEIRFPPGISLNSSGGPERRTQIVALASGHEERNTPWSRSRRRYDAGYGVKSLDDLHAVIAFFEARMGRLHGFRWKDWTDFRSRPPGAAPTALDQALGAGDGVETAFQLTKRYQSGAQGHDRPINKPVAGTTLIAIGGAAQTEGADFTVDAATGVVTFTTPPAPGAALTAGFDFDTPARFDTDRLDIDLAGFKAGGIPSIPILEIRL